MISPGGFLLPSQVTASRPPWRRFIPDRALERLAGREAPLGSVSPRAAPLPARLTRVSISAWSSTRSFANVPSCRGCCVPWRRLAGRHGPRESPPVPSHRPRAADCGAERRGGRSEMARGRSGALPRGHGGLGGVPGASRSTGSPRDLCFGCPSQDDAWADVGVAPMALLGPHQARQSDAATTAEPAGQAHKADRDASQQIRRAVPRAARGLSRRRFVPRATPGRTVATWWKRVTGV